jgi:hypothetical protein
MRKVFAALLVASLLMGLFGMTVDAQSTFQRFENIWARTLRSTGNLTVGGAAAVTGNATVGGTLATTGASTAASYTASGAVGVGTFIGNTPGATQVLSFDSVLTPVSSNQPISALEAIGTASIAVPAAGRLLMITNVGSNAIVFTDTGTLKLSGNITLGALDTLLLQSDGTNWVQFATTNN